MGERQMDASSTMQPPPMYDTSSQASSTMQPPPMYDTSSQDQSLSLTQYHEYPTSQPFINTHFRRTPGKQTTAYPENNRDAVVSALRSLQDKVRRLELERSAAEDNLKTIASETSHYKNMLQSDADNKTTTTALVNKQTKELGSQLSAAETKCGLLEKQLDYMRKMVHNVERDRMDTVARTVVVEHRNKEEETPRKLKFQAERISELEREHLKLTATQNLAESKIRELEDRLREERVNRRLLQHQTEHPSQDTACLHHQPLFTNGEVNARPTVKTKKTTKKKKKKIVAPKKTNNHTTRRPEPGKHYRLNLAEIPFVAGKATTPSHSVGANVQRVLAWMKTHNLALCSDHYGNGTGEVAGGTESGASSSSSSHSIDTDLADILLALQDEFGQLSCEHQELVKQVQETADARLLDDMERELDSLVTRMEDKGRQIAKIRQHQHKVDDMKRKMKSKKPKAGPPPRPRSAMASFPPRKPPSESSHCHSRTKTQSTSASHHTSKHHPTGGRQVSLDMLRDMKKLQTTLRKDDLCWEKA